MTDFKKDTRTADTTMSDTIKKIEGIAHDNAENNMAQDGYTKFVHKNSILPAHNRHYCRPALLLVSTDDTLPEVMTKAEVGEMIWQMNVCGYQESQVKAIAAKHGITL